MTTSAPAADRRGTANRSEIAQLADRLDETERRLVRIENTLTEVLCRTRGISVGGPCPNCNRSLLVIENEQVYCPVCRYRLAVADTATTRSPA